MFCSCEAWSTTAIAARCVLGGGHCFPSQSLHIPVQQESPQEGRQRRVQCKLEPWGLGSGHSELSLFGLVEAGKLQPTVVSVCRKCKLKMVVFIV